MSETGGTKPDVAGNRWATTAPPNPITEPLGAKKDVGYALNEKPSSAHFNWLLWINGIVDNWLDAAHIREFSDLNEAIAATVTPQLFRIGQPAAGNYLPKVDVFTPATPASISGNIQDVKTDGEQIYVYDDARNLVAINPETGAEIWNVTFGATVNISSKIAAPGDFIYIGGAGGSPGLVEVNRATGAEVQRAGAGLIGNNGIVSNGVYAVGIGSTPSTIYFYSGLGATLAEDGSVALGGNYQATSAAIDRNRVYILAYDVIAQTSQIRAYDLAGRSLLWTFNNPVGIAAKQNLDIATDGEFVYAANVLGTHSTSGNLFNALVIDRHGFEMNHTRIGGFSDLDRVETDGRLCYFGEDSTGTTRVASTRGLSLGYLWGQGDVRTTDVDGVSACGYDSTNKLVRRRSADQAVTFQRVDGDDANRRPLHNLAIPPR
jgi:hypothetical protein